jgi:hypothetical protein
VSRKRVSIQRWELSVLGDAVKEVKDLPVICVWVYMEVVGEEIV